MDANDELAQACAEVVSTRSEEESLKRRSEIILPNLRRIALKSAVSDDPRMTLLATLVLA